MTTPTLERKQLSLDTFSLGVQGHGSFSGYASVFNGVDAQGDTVVQGAYSDTIPKFLTDGFIAWGHDDTVPVAYPTVAREDDRGLYLEANFHSTPAAQAARQIIAERMTAGKRAGISIGYYPVKTESGPDGTRRLLAIDLVEASLVMAPADDNARVAAVKQATRETKGAIGVHHTATSTGTWDGPANEARLSNDAGAATYRKAAAWQNPDGDPATKADWAFWHHEVSSDGTVGAANLKACVSGIGVLNGGRGVDVAAQPWGKDRAGIHAHLAAHEKDGNMEPTPLKTAEGRAQKGMYGMDAEPPPGSYEALAEDIEDAYTDAYLSGGGCACVVATYSDHAVLCVMPALGMMDGPLEMSYWDVPYTAADDGTVTLGTPTAVDAETHYVPAAKRALGPLRAWGLLVKAGVASTPADRAALPAVAGTLRAALTHLHTLSPGAGDADTCQHGKAWPLHADAVLSAVDVASHDLQGFYIRALAQDALDRKEGRKLSAETRSLLQQCIDAEPGLAAAFGVIRQLLADTAPPAKGYRPRLDILSRRLRLAGILEGVPS